MLRQPIPPTGASPSPPCLPSTHPWVVFQSGLTRHQVDLYRRHARQRAQVALHRGDARRARHAAHRQQQHARLGNLGTGESQQPRSFREGFVPRAGEGGNAAHRQQQLARLGNLGTGIGGLSSPYAPACFPPAFLPKSTSPHPDGCTRLLETGALRGEALRSRVGDAQP